VTELDSKQPDAQIAIAVFSALKGRHLVPLLDQVCARRGVMSYEICGRDRTRGVCRARHELWWLIRNHAERHYSFFEIARLFQRDHATVRHGIQAHNRRVKP
jgi:chromosomal replication initiation ATPase DnaA